MVMGGFTGKRRESCEGVWKRAITRDPGAHGLWEGGVVEGADGQLDQGTELDFLCPEPG